MIKNGNNYGRGQPDLTGMGMAAGGAGIGGGMITINNRFNRNVEHVGMEYGTGGMMLGQGNYTEYSGGLFDGMALSSDFLGEYYSNVSTPNCSESTKCDQEFCPQG